MVRQPKMDISKKHKGGPFGSAGGRIPEEGAYEYRTLTTNYFEQGRNSGFFKKSSALPKMFFKFCKKYAFIARIFDNCLSLNSTHCLPKFFPTSIMQI